MSFSKNPAAYPSEVAELFELAATADETLIIPCGTRKRAKYLQMRLHAFKYAVAHTKGHHLYPLAINFSKQIVINEKEDIVIQHVSEGKDAVLFRGYLNSVIAVPVEIPPEVLAAVEAEKANKA